jgi:hypothetical protein
MKPGSTFLMLSLLLLTAGLQAVQAEDATPPDPRVVAGRALSQQFGGELKSALERAMAEKGPPAAILVCKDEAPRIAARLSAEHGVTAGRTALRVRNPANTPQPWQRAGLESFERQLAAGAKADALELFELRPDGGARYMKAIVTAPLCVVCHGRNIAPEVQLALKDHYPRDRATGFRPGDLRGAFSIEWPAAKRATP